MAATNLTKAAKGGPKTPNSKTVQAKPESGGSKTAAASSQTASTTRGGPKVLSPDLYSKLVAILLSQRRLGNYPPTVERLLELANLPWPGGEAMTGGEAQKHFQTTAAKPKSGAPNKTATLPALVFLVEDKGRLASYERTIRTLIERSLAGSKTQSCSISPMLKKCMNTELRSALDKQLRERLAARRLPPGIGALKVGAHYQFFCFDQIIGTPVAPLPQAAEAKPAIFAPNDDSHDPRCKGSVTEAPSADTPRMTPETQIDPSGSIDAAQFDLTTRMQDLFDRLDRQSGGNNQILLHDLRRELAVPRGEFDACMNQLRSKGVFTLSPEEGRFGHLSAEQVEAGMDGPSGRLVYVARR